MHGSKQVVLQRQHGVSLSGLIFVLGIALVLAMLALKVVPTVIEYKAAKDAIVAAKKTDGTVAAIRLAFDKNADINDIDSVTGKDLIITKVGNDTEVAFAYRKEIPLFTNVFLAIDYAATTDPSGVTPEKPEPAPK